jgi:hypothetical protein
MIMFFEKKKNYFSFAGCFPLAPYLVHPPKARFTSVDCGGLVTFGAGGHNFFF